MFNSILHLTLHVLSRSYETSENCQNFCVNFEAETSPRLSKTSRQHQLFAQSDSFLVIISNWRNDTFLPETLIFFQRITRVTIVVVPNFFPATFHFMKVQVNFVTFLNNRFEILLNKKLYFKSSFQFGILYLKSWQTKLVAHFSLLSVLEFLV